VVADQGRVLRQPQVGGHRLRGFGPLAQEREELALVAGLVDGLGEGVGDVVVVRPPGVGDLQRPTRARRILQLQLAQAEPVLGLPVAGIAGVSASAATGRASIEIRPAR